MNESPAHRTRSKTTSLSCTTHHGTSNADAAARMFTLEEVRACGNSNDALGKLLFDRQLLIPWTRTCLRCSELMHVYDDERNALGKRLRCTPCNTDESVKRGSIFEHFHTPLVKLCELLCYFDAELTVTQTAHLTSISDDTISTFWKRIRESMAVFNEEHPVMYGPGDCRN